MRHTFLIVSALMALMTFSAAAQDGSALEPGLYNIVEGTPTLMSTQRGTQVSTDDNDMLLLTKFNYAGVSSGIISDGQFLMVCDPAKKNPLVTLNKYGIFTSKLTPEDMMIVPLTVEKKRRSYDCRKLKTVGLTKVEWIKMDFDFEEVSECTYRITADLPRGEYAAVFRYTLPVWNFDFNQVFPFTVR